MLKVGLTGGIASGKSTVGEMLVARGAHLTRADEISHRLMNPGKPVYEEVIRRFGRGVLNADGTVNRARLAEAAFGSGGASRIEELNQIVHPAVLKEQQAWMESVGLSDPRAIAVVEAALLLEAGARSQFDRLIVVTCRPEQRIERWAERVHVDSEVARKEVARRMAAQLPDAEKVKAADYVIDNSGTVAETEKQVAEVFAALESETDKAGTSGGTLKPGTGLPG
jgi:dephospho-CoA kinase